MAIRDCKPKYSYHDISIVPCEISMINHRCECNIYNKDGFLPLFTAPMPTVVDDKNFDLFEENKIRTILPRTLDINLRLEHSKRLFSAYSLDEFEKYFIEKQDGRKFVCVDIANGHMNRLLDLIKECKGNNRDNVCLMVGNIANPKTYEILSECDVDYVKCGIGNGSACLTSANAAIHYPYASLLDEINSIKLNLFDNSKKYAYVIADGGIRNYSDIIKALALGADYVMCGNLFTRMEESAAEIFYDKDSNKYYKEYYGMSTKKAQKMMGRENLHTSEGISFFVEVEYTMKGWIDNFSDYLRSAMSYCNKKNIEDFIGNVDIIPITPMAFKSFDK